MNWLSTENKRMASFVAMGICAYFALALNFGWSIPEFLTTKYVGGFSLIAIAGILTFYAIYMFNDIY